jgi:hypothetical protein
MVREIFCRFCAVLVIALASQRICPVWARSLGSCYVRDNR